YDLADIDNLRFDGATAAQPPPPPPAPPASQAPPPPSAVSRPSSGLSIPAGTDVSIRTIDAVDSEHDRRGQTYRASVDQPVIVNGQTVIPRGADAVIMLSDAQQSGKIEGRTVLTLELRSISVNGRTYDSA